MSSSAVAQPAYGATRWPLHLGLLAAAMILWAFAYQGDIARAVQIWWISPTYSHCFLVVPISVWLIWRRRRYLAKAHPQFYASAMWIMIPVALLWLVGKAAAINEAEQLAVMLQFEALLLLLLGPGVVRTILFPCLFLLFLVPMGQYLVPPLQSLTTAFVSHGLTFLGILHYTEGNVIQLANGTFEVAEACVGLRFLIATIVLGTVFAYCAFRRPYKMALFMAASIVIPVIANGIRALGIVLIAHWSNNRLATGADHIVYGWGFSVLILLALFAIAGRYRDEVPAEQQPPVLRAKQTGSGLWLAIPAIFLACMPPALAQTQQSLMRHGEPVLARPARAAWKVGAATSPWQPDLPPADKSTRFSMRQAGGDPVDVLVDYYAGTGKDDTLVVAPQRLWDEQRYNLVSHADVYPNVSNQAVPFQEFLLSSAGETRLVWWSYWKDGRFTTSGTALKWMALRNLLRGDGGASLVALSVPVTGSRQDARKKLESASWVLSGLAGKDGS